MITVHIDGATHVLELPIAIVRDALRALRHSGVSAVRSAARKATAILEGTP